MEFDEMKRIWDAQTDQPLYVIDEKALHLCIQSELGGERRLAGGREWSTILFYLGAVGLMLFFGRLNHVKPGANIFAYLLAAWMFGTVVYIVVSRTRRLKAGRRFDRSIRGDLNYAIWLAGYQMRLGLVIGFNFVPLGSFAILFGWEIGRLFMACAGVILVSGTLTFFIERKGFRASQKRKQALQVLKGKLESGS
jgi:hypothetical protein